MSIFDCLNLICKCGRGIFLLWLKGCGYGKLVFENDFGVKTQFKIMEPGILQTM